MSHVVGIMILHLRAVYAQPCDVAMSFNEDANSEDASVDGPEQADVRSHPAGDGEQGAIHRRSSR